MVPCDLPIPGEVWRPPNLDHVQNLQDGRQETHGAGQRFEGQDAHRKVQGENRLVHPGKEWLDWSPGEGSQGLVHF